MWKFEFKQPVGLRVLSRKNFFRGVTTFRLDDKPDAPYLYWYGYLKKWMTTEDIHAYIKEVKENTSEAEFNRLCTLSRFSMHGTSNWGEHSPRSLKAFKKYLDRHPELKDHEVVLTSNFIGYSISAFWEEPVLGKIENISGIEWKDFLVEFDSKIEKEKLDETGSRKHYFGTR